VGTGTVSQTREAGGIKRILGLTGEMPTRMGLTIVGVILVVFTTLLTLGTKYFIGLLVALVVVIAAIHLGRARFRKQPPGCKAILP
jgi:hypothetical protein